MAETVQQLLRERACDDTTALIFGDDSWTWREHVAEAENLVTGVVRHTASAYLTFVALDENGKPKPAPALILETEEERRRNQEALMRRTMRLDLRTAKS